MRWQNRVIGKFGLLLLLSGLAMLLSACDRDLWRAMDKLLAVDERLGAVERQAATALRTAEEAKALAERGGVAPTPVCTPAPEGSATINEGGVALRAESSISPTLQLYPVTKVKVYGKNNFAKFLAESTDLKQAAVMFAVASTGASTETVTLYAENASVRPTGPNLNWHIYSLTTSTVISQPSSNLALTPPLAISTAITFSLPAGGEPDQRLNQSLEALGNRSFSRPLARYLLLVQQENNQPVYTLIVFEGSGSGAGNSRICVWCINCGSPCRGVCRWYNCG